MEDVDELTDLAWLRDVEDWVESSGFSSWLLAPDGSRRVQPCGAQVVLVAQG